MNKLLITSVYSTCALVFFVFFLYFKSYFLHMEQFKTTWKPEFARHFDIVSAGWNSLQKHVYTKYFGQVTTPLEETVRIEESLADWLHEDAPREELLEYIHWANKLVDWEELKKMENQFCFTHEG